MLKHIYALTNAIKLSTSKKIAGKSLAINVGISTALYASSDIFAQEYDLYIMQCRPKYYGSERLYLEEVSSVFTLLYFVSGAQTLRYFARSRFVAERIMHVTLFLHQSYQYGSWFNKRWILAANPKYYAMNNYLSNYYKQSTPRIINIAITTYTVMATVVTMLLPVI